jgi:hypothetical protein
MRAALAKIHIDKKEHVIDEDTYRDVMERVTGKRSSKGMSFAQHASVLDEFKRLGWKAKRRSRSRKTGMAGKYLPKCQALWISGYHLGLIRNPDDAAMAAFIKRQTGLSHERFLIHAGDAAKAIEALKSMLARDGGVKWQDYPDQPQLCVIEAQWLKLVEIGAVHSTIPGRPFDDLENYARAVTRHPNFSFYKQADWNKLMSALGRKLRYEISKTGGDQ